MTDTQTITQENPLSGFAALFEASEEKQDIGSEGEIVSGIIIQVTRDSVVVDIGGKSEGVIARNEFVTADGALSVKAGDRVDVFVESRESDDGLISLSKEKADKMKVWDEISSACERDEIIEGTISQRVKGGLSVTIRGGVKAFLPGSRSISDPSATSKSSSVRPTSSRSSSSTRSGATSCSRVARCSSVSATR